MAPTISRPAPPRLEPTYSCGPAAYAAIAVTSSIALLAGVAVAAAMPPVVLMLAAVVAPAVGVSAFRRRANQIRQAALRDRLVLHLMPLTGTSQPDRRTVVLAKWNDAGVPTSVRVTCSARVAAAAEDPQWAEDVTTVLRDRLQHGFEISRTDERTASFWFTSTGPVPIWSKEPSVARAAAALSRLLGPSAKITTADVAADGSLRALEVSHQAGDKLASAGYRARVEQVFNTMHSGRWRGVWNLEADTVRLEQRPTLPDSVWLPDRALGDTDDIMENYRQLEIPLALDEDGHEIVWRPAVVPQFLLTGSTGSGKTSTMHTIVAKVTQAGLPVWILDGKRIEFLEFRDWPNVQFVGGGVPQQVALMYRMKAVMDARYLLIEEGRAQVTDFEPIFVIVDEFTEFRSNLLDWYSKVKGKSDPRIPITLSHFESLARLARSARIHMVVSAQRPDASILGGEMRSNFGMRMSMGRLDYEGARMMWQNPTVGVTLPREKTGRAMAPNRDGIPVEVQAYRFPNLREQMSDIENKIIESVRPAEARHGRYVIEPPESLADLDTSEIQEPGVDDWLDARWDTAEARPDLDPLSANGAGDYDPVEARRLASVATVLNIGGGTQKSITTTRRPSPEIEQVRHLSAVDEAGSGDGYGIEVSRDPLELAVGDLVELEIDGGPAWVTVDEEPFHDSSSETVTISYRTDTDEFGVMDLTVDDLVLARSMPRNEESA